MNPAHRYRYIDALRALAALAVIFFHMSRALLHQNAPMLDGEKWIYALTSDYLNLGKIAVIVFFAISGFVVPFSLLNAQTNPLLSFATSRFFRLYPAYWLSIPFGIYFFYILAEHPITAKLITFNALMLQQFVGAENIIGLYWTLQIELIFYVCCAILFYMGLLKSNRATFWVCIANIALALLLAIARYVLDKKLPVALPLSLTIMFWGILWRRYLLDQQHDAKQYAYIIIALLAVLIAPISLLAYNKDMGFGETWYSYTAAYCSAVMIFVIFTKFIRLHSAFLAYLGTISYSIYLFGPIAQEVVMRYVPMTVFGNVSSLYILLAMGVASLWAAAVYQCIEKPAIALGRSIISSFK